MLIRKAPEISGSGFSRIIREFSGRIRMKFSGIPRITRKFSGRIRMKCSGIFRIRISPDHPEIFPADPDEMLRNSPDHPEIFRADPDEKLRNFPDPDFPGSSGNFPGGFGWNAPEFSGSGFPRIIREFSGRIRMKCSGIPRIIRKFPGGSGWNAPEFRMNRRSGCPCLFTTQI